MVDIQKGKEIYEKVKEKLKGKEGKMIFIEVESEDYFLGDDTMEAYNKARKKYPNKIFYATRVGDRAAYRIGGIYDNTLFTGIPLRRDRNTCAKN